MKHYLLLMALPLVMALPVAATAQDETGRKDYYLDKTLVEAFVPDTRLTLTEKRDWLTRLRLNATQQSMLTAGLNRDACPGWSRDCIIKVSIRTTFADAWKNGNQRRRLAIFSEIRNDVNEHVSRERGILPCGACPGFQVP